MQEHSGRGRSSQLRLKEFFYSRKVRNFAVHRFKGGGGGGETDPFSKRIAEGQAGGVCSMENVTAAGSVSGADWKGGVRKGLRPALCGHAPAASGATSDKDGDAVWLP